MSASLVSRRQFMKTSAAVSLAASVSAAGVHAAGSERIRIGLIGCGGRGRGAAEDCMNADPAVELVAMGDLFPDRLQGSYNDLVGKFKQRVKVTPQKTLPRSAISLSTCFATKPLPNAASKLNDSRPVGTKTICLRSFLHCHNRCVCPDGCSRAIASVMFSKNWPHLIESLLLCEIAVEYDKGIRLHW